MFATRIARSPRLVAAAVLVSTTLPLGLLGCSQALESDAQASELHAAHDSDLLAVPSERTFELAEFEITSPKALTTLNSLTTSRLNYSGHIVLSDGVITAGEFEFDVARLQPASFELTEPTVLRRAEGETDPVYAVGELSLGDLEPRVATVKLTPTLLDEESVEFVIDFELPAKLPLASGSSLTPSEISATVTLTALR